MDIKESFVSDIKSEHAIDELPGYYSHRRNTRRTRDTLLYFSCFAALILFLLKTPFCNLFASRVVERNPAYLIEAKHGAVATENILCSDIGVDVLKEGGNAVDAAVSATLCIGVVNMYS